MILIDDVLVSRAVVEEEFVCNLSACKGACCVEGDEGARVTRDEIAIIEALYEKVKPYLTKEGIEKIEATGFFYEQENGNLSLETLNNKACVFLNYDDKGVALCGIQQAHADGVVDWPKPVSCHLYPIRIDQYKDFDAVNYYEWDICSAACELGKQLKVPVYKFLKEPLVRKYGEDFFEQLEAAAKQLNNTEEEE